MKLKRQRQRKILISVFTLICAIVLLVLFFAVGSLIRENALLTFADGKRAQADIICNKVAAFRLTFGK